MGIYFETITKKNNKMNRKERVCLTLKKACNYTLDCLIMAVIACLVLVGTFALAGQSDVVLVLGITGAVFLGLTGVTYIIRRLVQ